MGAGWPSSVDQARVRNGNACSRVSIRLICLARLLGITVLLENPAGSQLWRLPRLAKLLKQLDSRSVMFDMCQYGTKWKKATTLAVAAFPLASHLSKTCQGQRGICSRTNLKHYILEGKDETGRCRTARAQAYPGQFCRKFAAQLRSQLISDYVSNSTRLVSHPPRCSKASSRQ